MDRTVQRIFIILIIIFSITFGILGVFFRATNILGFPGEYWAGIFCVGVVLLILGFVMLLNSRGTMSLNWSNLQRIPEIDVIRQIYPLAFISIIIAAFGLGLLVYFYLNIKTFTCSSEYSSLSLAFICLPIVCGIVSIFLGVKSFNKSLDISSDGNQYLSAAGFLLGLCCFLSSPILVIILILSDIS